MFFWERYFASDTFFYSGNIEQTISKNQLCIRKQFKCSKLIENVSIKTCVNYKIFFAKKLPRVEKYTMLIIQHNLRRSKKIVDRKKQLIQRGSKV